MRFPVHNYFVAKALCAQIGHVPEMYYDTFEGKPRIQLVCQFCRKYPRADGR